MSCIKAGNGLVYGRIWPSNPPDNGGVEGHSNKDIFVILDWSIVLNSCNLPYNVCLWTKDPLPSVLYEWPLGWEWGMFEGILLECAESSVPVFHETSFPTLHCGKLWENCIAASEGEEMSSAYLGGWQNCSIKYHLCENFSKLPNNDSYKLN